jgi:hypothetical protein
LCAVKAYGSEDMPLGLLPSAFGSQANVEMRAFLADDGTSWKDEWPEGEREGEEMDMF